MSTRSSIAILRANGVVLSVYCHFDGYLEGVGQALIDFHNSEEKAEALVALGDLSTVAGNERPEAYSRDRGEKFEDVKPHEWPTLDAYFFAGRNGQLGDNGYRYLWQTGGWHVWGNRKSAATPRGLKAEIERATAKAKDDEEEDD